MKFYFVWITKSSCNVCRPIKQAKKQTNKLPSRIQILTTIKVGCCQWPTPKSRSTPDQWWGYHAPVSASNMEICQQANSGQPSTLFLLKHSFKSSLFTTSKKRLSIITSNNSSKNLWCFCCLQDKTWIKMPILWKHSVFVFITEILWRTFWHNKWRSVFDVVKDSSFRF